MKKATLTKKKLEHLQADTSQHFLKKVKRTTAEELMQTLYRQGLLKLELRDLKPYLDDYFKGN